MSRRDRQKLRDRVARVSEFASRIGQSATQLALVSAGDPVLAIPAGAIVGQTINDVGKDLAHRLMSDSQARRAADFVEETVTLIQQHLDHGDRVRNDGFFEAGLRHDDAREVYEAAALVAADTPARRKLHHIAALSAAIPFRDDVSVETSAFLIKLLDQLTYRQLVLLAAFNDGTPVQKLRETSPLAEERLLVGAEIEAEMIDLDTRRLLGTGVTGGRIARISTDRFGGSNVRTTDLGEITLTPLGITLHDLADLAAIPTREQVAALRDAWHARPGGSE